MSPPQLSSSSRIHLPFPGVWGNTSFLRQPTASHSQKDFLHSFRSIVTSGRPNSCLSCVGLRGPLGCNKELVPTLFSIKFAGSPTFFVEKECSGCTRKRHTQPLFWDILKSAVWALREVRRLHTRPGTFEGHLQDGWSRMHISLAVEAVCLLPSDVAAS